MLILSSTWFQSTFKITLEVPSELVALSNMPVEEEKLDGPVKTLTFQESPIMSTYLVAVVVGLFDYVEAISTDGTIVCFKPLPFSCFTSFSRQLRPQLFSIIYYDVGTKVRVYTQVGKANQGQFALDVAVKTLDIYKE